MKVFARISFFLLTLLLFINLFSVFTLTTKKVSAETVLSFSLGATGSPAVSNNGIPGTTASGGIEGFTTMSSIDNNGKVTSVKPGNANLLDTINGNGSNAKAQENVGKVLNSLGSNTNKNTQQGNSSGYKPLEPVKLPNGKDLFSPDITAYLQNIYSFGIAIAGALAVIVIVVAGIEYMMSDAFTTKADAIGRIKAAFYGLGLALGSYVLLYTISPELVKLKFNLTPVSAPSSAQSGLNNIPGITAFNTGTGTARMRYYSSTEVGSDSGTAAGLNAYGGKLVANDNNDPSIVGSSASSYYPGGTIWTTTDGLGHTIYHVVDDNNRSNTTGQPVNNALTTANSFDNYTNQTVPGVGKADNAKVNVLFIPKTTVSHSTINGLHDVNNLKNYLNQNGIQGN